MAAGVGFKYKKQLRGKPPKEFQDFLQQSKVIGEQFHKLKQSCKGNRNQWLAGLRITNFSEQDANKFMDLFLNGNEVDFLESLIK
jgi:hypothetical protein